MTRTQRLLIAALLALPPGMAPAADLTIRFTGRFEHGTCTFSVPEVDLGTYQATSFTGSTATPWRRITVASSNCTSDIANIRMRFSGTADGDDSNYFAARNTTASGVAIELANGSSQRVVPNVTTLTWSRAVIGTNYDLYARLVQTRPALTAGAISTPITISFTYD